LEWGVPSERTAQGKLAPYRRKRDFARTPEPSGAPADSAKDGARRFVVQRHRARRLHYDFRLEIDGVLVSWAVPKGPTLDPKVRRAAFHVEDHPLEYYDFEGVIPAGEYGGGDVIVWDAGTWEPYETDNPATALDGGELHLVMRGEKLRGKFVLIHTPRGDNKDDWLLLHKRDEFAVDGWDPEQHPRSVLSGLTNDEVKADPERLWRSDQPVERAQVRLRAPAVGVDELAVLDALGDAGSWSVFGRDLRVAGLDEQLFPAQGRGRPVTRRDLLRYTARVAPVALPHLTGRILDVRRFPHGAGAPGRWQRELPARVPDWLPRSDDLDSGKARLVVDEPAALVWAAASGALEWYAGASTVRRHGRPDWLVLELSLRDPDRRGAWARLVEVAHLCRTAFEHLGVLSRPLLTGRAGLQIRVPATGVDVAAARDWARQLAATVTATAPDLLTEGGGPVTINADGNSPDRPQLAPYSPIATPGAPVCTPIDWEELQDKAVHPDKLTLRTVPERLDQHGDPLADTLRTQQRLPTLR
jgi:bifunctional non-homologous end joining protein LigD